MSVYHCPGSESKGPVEVQVVVVITAGQDMSSQRRVGDFGPQLQRSDIDPLTVGLQAEPQALERPARLAARDIDTADLELADAQRDRHGERGHSRRLRGVAGIRRLLW